MAKHLAPCARLGSDDRQFISIRATHALYTALATGSRDGHAFTEVGLHVRSDRGCGVEQDFKIRSAYRSTLLVVGRWLDPAMLLSCMSSLLSRR